MNHTFETQTLTLPPLLDEFRSALQDEIKEATRNGSNSAVPLTNGHKVGTQGSAHQYAFLIDSVLNTPDGAPGDLIVPGKAPMEATIVSAEGLRIVISVECDLGKFVPTARLQTNLTILMRKLIERIENNASAENPAATRMLGKAPVTGEPVTPEDTPKLNENQLCALKSALGRNLTVIWGPPGTGKTYTIGTIAEYLYKASRSVLLVSHTNIAVDQAIKHVAKSLKTHLKDGIVIRVGEVKDEVLKSDYPDVLLKKQVERQSRELFEKREALDVTKRSYAEELTNVQRTISIIEWVDSARADIESTANSLDVLGKKIQQEQETASEYAELRKQYTNLVELYECTRKVFVLRKQLSTKQDKQSNLQVQLSSSLADYKQIVKLIHEQESRIELSKRITPLRQERSTYPAPKEQKKVIAHLSAAIVEAKESLENTQTDYAKACALLDETRSVSTIARVLKRLPNPGNQQKVVSVLSKQETAFAAEMMAAQAAYEAATAKLARILELDGELSRYTTIGSYHEEVEKKKQIDRRLQQIDFKKSKIKTALANLQHQVKQLKVEEEQISGTIEGDVKDVYVDTCTRIQKYRELQVALKAIKSRLGEMRKKVDSGLERLVAELQTFGLLADIPSTPNEIMKAVCDAHEVLAEQHDPADLPALSEKVVSIDGEIQRLSSKIADIDTKLAQVEHEVINNASVLGATLTKTYLSDDIQGRKFDTVILDEASMAPIPALWAAALLSESNIIIVGDFKQLPPIVLSKKETTKKWLGRDIFEASGLKERWAERKSPPYFVPLVEQRRMVPEITEVANQFYDGLLRNAKTIPEGFQEFSEWYKTDWPNDNPIVLVDTGPLNAWVTSVVKGYKSSRLNFLSATVSMDLAEQLISPDRPYRSEGATKRILIVAPYRAHARLLSVLLRDSDHLQVEVVVGTVHSFQGTEADVVIFDLVVDEPHFRVNLFMPKLDEQLKCLLNVGLTRAKFRLFIVGDFDYCMSQGKKAFLGKTLLPFLLRFPRIDARELVPDGLAARAAKAQMTILGGDIDLDSERVVVTHADFYRLLLRDLSRAQKRIIIYSPFITQDRLSYMIPLFQAAISRGVEVFVITKAHSERSHSELAQIKKMEAHLSNIGVAIMHKLRMHEKLAFIDDDITWLGSLNPLSYSNTQEIMERRRSKIVLINYFQILRLQELLAVHGKPESKCPICESEILAAEGADQPYYWRCKNDHCYTRSIDQPYPFDGILTCGACNASLEFGYWGDYPHWRCSANSRHRQKVFKSHLRLPKMVSLIPKRERRKVCKMLHIESFNHFALDSDPIVDTKRKQISLFD